MNTCAFVGVLIKKLRQFRRCWIKKREYFVAKLLPYLSIHKSHEDKTLLLKEPVWKKLSCFPALLTVASLTRCQHNSPP